MAALVLVIACGKPNDTTARKPIEDAMPKTADALIVADAAADAVVDSAVTLQPADAGPVEKWCSNSLCVNGREQCESLGDQCSRARAWVCTTVRFRTGVVREDCVPRLDHCNRIQHSFSASPYVESASKCAVFRQ